MEKPARKKKILVVDDEPDIVDLIKVTLESEGYEVITANDGEEGLGKARIEKPDLMILDIIMPKMDGYTVVKRKKYDPEICAIPTIILTGKAEMEDLFKIEGIGDYLIKPFDVKHLLGLIRKHLAN